jgi:prepilin-type N-terminal cleavage/methylation domain-containing protein
MKKGFTIIEAMIVIAITGIIFAVIIQAFETSKYKNMLKGKGYNVEEVSVFLNGTSYGYKDFYNSRGLQKQYDIFINGENSEFMREARANKASRDAKDTANMALAISVMNSGD